MIFRQRWVTIWGQLENKLSSIWGQTWGCGGQNDTYFLGSLGCLRLTGKLGKHAKRNSWATIWGQSKYGY